MLETNAKAYVLNWEEGGDSLVIKIIGILSFKTLP